MSEPEVKVPTMSLVELGKRVGMSPGGVLSWLSGMGTPVNGLKAQGMLVTEEVAQRMEAEVRLWKATWLEWDYRVKLAGEKYGPACRRLLEETSRGPVMSSVVRKKLMQEGFSRWTLEVAWKMLRLCRWCMGVYEPGKKGKIGWFWERPR